MKEREALKMALEALEYASLCIESVDFDFEPEITAIKEALAQPAVSKTHKQEPVAWLQKSWLKALDQAANGSHLDDVPNHDDDSVRMIAWSLGPCWQREKLLAHADRLEMASLLAIKHTTPPQRTWVGLTGDEVKHEWEVWRANVPRYAGFAKGIEAKLKEKNT